MSGNGEKLSRQRQEQQRPSLPNHSCPVFISSSPSRISFSSSHGRNSLSTKETETRIHSTSKRKPSGRKQCLKDSQRTETCSYVIKRCKSTDNIRYLNAQDKQLQQSEINIETTQIKIKKRSLSYPALEKDFIGESESIQSIDHRDASLFLDRNADRLDSSNKCNNSRKPLKTISHVKQANGNVERPKVVRKRSSTKTSIKSNSSDNVQTRTSFPNSLLLFPFPTTPVEKCFSPKTPSTFSPAAWNNCDRTDPPTTDKKTKGARFEFGANFLRRFSLTQLTS